MRVEETGPVVVVNALRRTCHSSAPGKTAPAQFSLSTVQLSARIRQEKCHRGRGSSHACIIAGFAREEGWVIAAILPTACVGEKGCWADVASIATLAVIGED
jgi:hypothetical protein